MDRLFDFRFDAADSVLIPCDRKTEACITAVDHVFTSNYNAHVLNREQLLLGSLSLPYDIEVARRSEQRSREFLDEINKFSKPSPAEGEEAETAKKRTFQDANMYLGSELIAQDARFFDFYFLGWRIFNCNPFERKLLLHALLTYPDYALLETADSAGAFVQYLFESVVSSSELLQTNLDLPIDGDKSCLKLISWIYHLPWYFQSLASLRSVWKTAILEKSHLLCTFANGFLLKWMCNQGVFRPYWEKYKGVTQTYYYRSTEDLKDFVEKNMADLFRQVVPNYDRIDNWIQNDYLSIFRDCAKEKEKDEVSADHRTQQTRLTVAKLALWLKDFLFVDLLFDMANFPSGIVLPLYIELCSPSKDNELIDTRLHFKQDEKKKKTEIVPVSIYKPCAVLDRENESMFQTLVESLSAKRLPAEFLPANVSIFVDDLRKHSTATSEQLECIEQMLRQPVSFLYGPPGTGKTSQGIARVVEFCRPRGFQIVCLAPTGKAFREMCRYLQTLELPGLEAEDAPFKNPLAGFRNRVVGGEEYEDDDDDEGEDDDVDSVFLDNLESPTKEVTEKSLDIFKDGVSILDSCQWKKDAYCAIRNQLYNVFGLHPPCEVPLDYRSASILSDPRHPLKKKTPYHPYLSGTIHRFLFIFRKYLQSLKEDQKFVLIVDEMSMVSAQLFHSLLSQIIDLCTKKCVFQSKNKRPCRAEIVKVLFCGDPDQLPSIGYGNVFNALLESEQYMDLHREYTKLMRQHASSSALCDLMQELRAKIHHGNKCGLRTSTDSLRIALKPNPAAGVEVVVVDYDRNDKTESLSYIREFVHQNFQRKLLPYVKPLMQVVTYKSDPRNVWNESIQHRFREWKRERGFFTGGTDDSVGKKHRFYLYDKVRRNLNVRVKSDPGLNIQYFLSNGDDAFIVAIDGDKVELEYLMDGKREVLTRSNFLSTFVLAYAFTIHGAQGMSHERTLLDSCDEDMKCSAYESQLFYVAASRPKESLTMVIARSSSHSKENVRFLRCFAPISPFLRNESSKYVAGACGSCGELIFCKHKLVRETKIKMKSCALCT